MPFYSYLLSVGNTGRYGNGNLLAFNLQNTFVGGCGLLQCQLQCCLQVIHSLLSFCPERTAAENLFEKVAEPAPVARTAPEITESTEPSKIKILRSASKAVCSLPLRLELLTVLPVLAILVVALALLTVAQHFVRFVYLLESLLCLRVVLVDVGVVLLCQFAVGFFNLFLRCVALHTKYLVVIYECHNKVFVL